MDIPDVDAKLKASRVNHVVATYERISTGRHEVVHHRYGAGVSKTGKGDQSGGGDPRLRQYRLMTSTR